jgi:Rps23 Pro-64 3,4-dihydroxylase Tpa1-like proline 4-hydroxylase
MKIKEYCDSKIVVIDDLFGFSEISGFETDFMSLSYEINNTNSMEVQNKTNSRLVHRLQENTLKKLNFYNEKSLSIFHKYINSEKYSFWRSYVNLGIHSDQHHIHTDHWQENEGITLIYYVNQTWDRSWGGSTLFFDDSCNDIIFNCQLVPGRVVIFDSAIPHSATSQHYQAAPFRFTFVTKFVSNQSLSDRLN